MNFVKNYLATIFDIDFKGYNIDKKDQIFFSGMAFLTFALVAFVILYVFYVAYPVLRQEGLIDFVLGDRWVNGDMYEKGIYGIRNYALSTLYLTIITLMIAMPLGVLSAIYLAEFAPKRVEMVFRPMIELLVGIPSVVYGIFGFFILEDIFQHHIDPYMDAKLGFISLFKDANPNDGFHLLLASTVLAVMILPTITTLSQDAIKSVSNEYRLASFSVGATKWETIKLVILPVAKKGIIASIVLATMRAMGETMAVLMLFGGSSSAPTSLLDAGTAMTSKILGNLPSFFTEPEVVSALFAIAAILFGMQILSVALIKVLGGSIEIPKH